jgi:hypothetical protein
MKYLKIIILILVFLILKDLIANPIEIFFISELKIDSTEWKLETNEFFPLEEGKPLTGWYLTSLTDTAYFKDGIVKESYFMVIDNSYLSTDFFINPMGDKIRIYNSNNDLYDTFIFGEVDGSTIIKPLPSQSISRTWNNTGSDLYYLDNSPTLGMRNDTLNAMGYLKGKVTDANDTPVSNFEIVYGEGDFEEILSYFTDNNGEFFHKGLAISQYFCTRDWRFLACKQITPEDTVEITITFDTTQTDIVVKDENSLPSKYLLNQNYPNPFNNSTKITFYLPKAENVEIIIYDINGKRITDLFSGHLSNGAHTIQWHSDLIASGTYIYQLKTSSTILSKKCIVVK